MGFWSSLGSVISSPVKNIGRAVGSVIEKTGSFLGSEKIEKFGRGIKDACSKTAYETGKTDEYDKHTASINQTVMMNEILAGFSIGLQNQADLLEADSIKEIRYYYDDLIERLEEGNLQLNTKRLRMTMNKISREIHGSLKSYLAKRVSLDDRECLEILEMPAGEEKTRLMNNFGQNVIKEGLHNLSTQIQKMIEEQNEELEETLNSIVEAKETELTSTQEQVKQMLEQIIDDAVDKESAKVKPMLIISATKSIQANLQD